MSRFHFLNPSFSQKSVLIEFLKRQAVNCNNAEIQVVAQPVHFKEEKKKEAEHNSISMKLTVMLDLDLQKEVLSIYRHSLDLIVE